MRTRLVLVDDHGMMRAGLRSMLEHEPGVEVVGEASCGWEALEVVDRQQPDVVVMDVAMDGLNGIDATRRLIRAMPHRRVVMLSAYRQRATVLAALEAGAMGYVLKSSGRKELLRAVRAARSGQKYLSPSLCEIVVNSYLRRLHPGDDESAADRLGPREREVLQLLAEGHSSKQAATKLRVSPRTIETHRRNIMRKLGLHSVAELTKYAVRTGLTSLD